VPEHRDQGLPDTVGPGLSLTYRVTAWQRTNGYFTRRRPGQRRPPTLNTGRTTPRPRRSGRPSPRPARECSTSAPEPAGKLTATLVALGAEVIAVEPDPAMLTELRHALS
jgi:hypothetical protein